jgi:hypothetical protein
VVTVDKNGVNDKNAFDESAVENVISVRVDLRLLSVYLGADHISPKRVLVRKCGTHA